MTAEDTNRSINLEELRAEMEAEAEIPQPTPTDIAKELIQDRKATESLKLKTYATLSKWLQEVKKAPSEDINLQLLDIDREIAELVISASGREEDLSEYMEVESLESKHSRRQKAPIGVFTGIYFYGTKEGIDPQTKEPIEIPMREELLLKSGTITLVCAPTSHGKTTMLENLAMQALRQEEEEGSVLFFSVEEDSDAIEDSFLNIYMNRELSNKEDNSTTIDLYMKQEDPMKQARLFSSPETFKAFQAKEKEFNDKYIKTDKLKIIYEETRNVDKIKKVALYIEKTLKERYPDKRPIKAVFIDYIQRLNKAGNFNGNSKAQLASITNDLMTLSIKMQVPFVIAVQFNRQVHSPIEMDLKDIGEASEIEFCANKAILCWNSSKKASHKSTEWRKKKKEEETTELTKEAKDFEKRTGISVGKAGKTYAILSKNRKGKDNIECVFNFNGNTGVMTQETEKHELAKAWKDHIAKIEIQNALTGGGIEKHDYIDPNGSGEAPTKKPHVPKSISEIRKAEQAQKKAEKEAQKKAEKEAQKKAQAEATADTEETAQPQQEVTTDSIKASIESEIDRYRAKQEAGSSEAPAPSEPEDPTNAIGTSEVEAPPF